MGRLSDGFTELMHVVDRRIGWHRLPVPLGILTLRQMRQRLRERNLHDTGTPPTLRAGANGRPLDLTVRTLEGVWTDLDNPLMGAAGSRMGRNVPLQHTWPEEEPRLLTPNPRRVSLELMTRDEFRPATILNVLAAAWIQFEVHDWFGHGANEQENPIEVELADSDPWPERPMRVERTRRDATAEPDKPQTWVNLDSHWWDGSQLYGRTQAIADKLRAYEGGKLRVTDDGLLPLDLQEGLDLRDVYGNHWIGLEMLNTLFTLEHNAICDRLKAEYPTWGDEQLYQRARLVNSALQAKIHTVDWTPAILPHPTTAHAMQTQWWGLQSESLAKKFGRLTKSELLSGIPGSATNHHGVPYALTEEFVAVYRLHPLLPDEFTFRTTRDDSVVAEHEFPELNALHARTRLGEVGLANALYSLGVAHPGAVTLHNFPKFLQNLDRPDGTKMDLAAVDILRMRERGVPRYNDFRELFHRNRISSFEELTPDRDWQEQLRGLYGDVDEVDLMVGLYAEPLPKGFGFSDTAFRVFILMASRRLNSDRFFTSDYRPEVYTPAGLRWVADNDFRSVLLRHFPQLGPALEGVSNPFAPWRRVAETRGSRWPAAAAASKGA
ncbi:MAG: peroxidase family protein [Actinomycetota bacterium]